jgi:hypothetical protein
MSKLDTIVNTINTALKANSFKSGQFKRGVVYGIAEIIPFNDGITMPAIVQNSGDAEQIAIDDTYPFQLYHRIEGIEGEETEGYDDVIETANMRLVIIADRSILKLKREDLVSMVYASFIGEISKSEQSSLNIYECSIEYGTFELNSQEVFNAEYNIGDYQLSNQTIMIAMPYTIMTKYRKKCLLTC